MDTLDQYRVFVQVAEMGSFIRAAHALELPRASVSAAIQQLESTVGTRLLHRTTRQLPHVPEAGASGSSSSVVSSVAIKKREPPLRRTIRPLRPRHPRPHASA